MLNQNPEERGTTRIAKLFAAIPGNSGLWLYVVAPFTI